MNHAERTLLKLLDIAINQRTLPIPEYVDWPQVMKLAQRQGVRALVYEALELLKQAGEGGSFPDRMTVMQCYAQTAFVEKMYAQHLALAKQVAALWQQHKVKTIVFKGVAHSRYYTKPGHREFGDLDCYLIDGQGHCAYHIGNDVARTMGLAVDDGWYKHSHIQYKQLTIENHQYFTAARRGGADKWLHDFMVD